MGALSPVEVTEALFRAPTGKCSIILEINYSKNFLHSIKESRKRGTKAAHVAQGG
jgi:hypothetical protein